MGGLTSTCDHGIRGSPTWLVCLTKAKIIQPDVWTSAYWMKIILSDWDDKVLDVMCETESARFLHVTRKHSVIQLVPSRHKARHGGSSSQVHLVPYSSALLSLASLCSVTPSMMNSSASEPCGTPPSRAAQQRHKGQREGHHHQLRLNNKWQYFQNTQAVILKTRRNKDGREVIWCKEISAVQAELWWCPQGVGISFTHQREGITEWDRAEGTF